MNHEKLRLRDPDIIPTREILKPVLGNSYSAYEILEDKLVEFDIEQNWQWYTPHKAWYAKGQFFWITSRGTRKEKTLFWLHVFDGYFSVAVWFLEKNREKLLWNDISDETKQVIREAKTFGKLATFPVIVEVKCVKSLTDIYKLINCKKTLET